MSTLQERFALAMAPPCTVTAADLARVCGVKPPSVHEWLNGPTKTLKGPNAIKAARELGVNADWLSTGKGTMRTHGGARTSAAMDSDAQSHAQVIPLLEAVAAVQSLLATVLAESIQPVGKVFLHKLRTLDPHVRNGPYVKQLKDALALDLANQEARRQKAASRKPRGSAS